MNSSLISRDRNQITINTQLAIQETNKQSVLSSVLNFATLSHCRRISLDGRQVQLTADNILRSKEINIIVK